MSSAGDKEPARPRRFYKDVSISAPDDEGHYAVLLDGRTARTSSGAVLRAPSAALGELIAEEWAGQSETLAPESMRLTQLAAAALEMNTETRARVIDEIAAYAETDLTAHLADEPMALAERQEAAWAGLRDWAGERFGIALIPVAGVIAQPQPPETLAAARAALEALDNFELAATAYATQLLGSVVLGLAVREAHLDAEAACVAATIDETFQQERWGVVDEARQRQTRLRADVSACARFLAARRSQGPSPGDAPR